MRINPSDIAQIIQIKKSDTVRSIYDTLMFYGSVIDLTNATVSLNIYNPLTDVNVSRAATVVVAASGSVQYQLVSADVAVTGSFLSEWQIIYQNGTELSVPTSGYNLIEIVEDLDS